MDEVVVLGAGVIGLTTAIGLAEGGVPVRVWAAEPPERTTSRVAGALWGPAFGEPQLGWSLATKAEFDQLALDPATGVRQVRGREVSDISADPPPWVDHLPELEYCDPATLPHGMLIGLRTTVPVVTMPVYLRYLTDRLAEARALARAGLDVELVDAGVGHDHVLAAHRLHRGVTGQLQGAEAGAVDHDRRDVEAVH